MDEAGRVGEDWEPVALPSAAELLHPELFLEEQSSEQVPETPPDEEYARFLPARAPWKAWFAAGLTVASVGLAAATVGAAAGVAGAMGIGAYLRAVAVLVVCAFVIVRAWRWARTARTVVPHR